MNWRQLVTTLDRQVPAGNVTTYAEVSPWGYGTPHRGHQRLTSRVVRTDGRLADLPEGSGQQRQQLPGGGVPFTAEGAVDFYRFSPKELA